MNISNLGHAASVRDEAIMRASAAVRDDLPDTPYAEATFRYFLAAERKRVERSGRSLLLLLARLKSSKGVDNGFDPASVPTLFAALKGSLREVDFVGWYETGRVAGAMLPQREPVTSSEACRAIAERTLETLVQHLPPEVARRLHVRVVDVRPRMRI